MEKCRSFCEWTHTRIKINATGDVTLCCYMTKHIGNIFKTPLQSLWQSTVAQEIRKDAEQGHLHKFCENWEGCPYVHARDRTMKDIDWNRDGPTQIEICLPSAHCNIGGENPTDDNPACLMCVRNFDFHRAPDRTSEIVTHIKPFVPQLEQLFVGGVSEPFWKDKIFEVLDELNFKDHAHHIQVQTVTNGTTLTPHVIGKFVDTCEIFHLYASIDAGTSDTFRKLRRLDAYDKIKRNIADLCRHKNDSTQFVEIHNTLNLLNVHEMVKMVQDAKEMGVDRLGLNITHNPGFGYKHVPDLDGILLNASNSHLFEEWHEKAINEANRLGVKLATYKKFKAPKPKPPTGLVSITLPTKPAKRKNGNIKLA